MIIKLTISGVDQFINTNSILYTYDNSGLNLVLGNTGIVSLPITELFENNAPSPVSFPTYSSFVTTTAPSFLEVPHLTLSAICINLSRVLRIEEINSSNSLVRFDNETTVAVNLSAALLKAAIDTASAVTHNGLSGIQGGSAGQYYHLTASQYADLISTIVKPNDTATSSTTFVDVSDLKFPVLAGEKYWFRFVIYYAVSSTSVGSAWAINGPSGPTTIYRADWCSGTGRYHVDGLSGYDITSSNSSSISKTANMAIIEGFITCSSAGGVIARMLSSSGTGLLTAKSFSTVQYKKIS